MDTEQLVGTSMLRGNQKLNTNDSAFYHGQHLQTHYKWFPNCWEPTPSKIDLSFYLTLQMIIV